MNTKWHEENPFPENGTDEEKDLWRQSHTHNCNCSKMMLPYRRSSRDEK